MTKKPHHTAADIEGLARDEAAADAYGKAQVDLPYEPTDSTHETLPVYVGEIKERPEMPARFTNGGATAEERDAWVKEHWPPPMALTEGDEAENGD